MKLQFLDSCYSAELAETGADVVHPLSGQIRSFRTRPSPGGILESDGSTAILTGSGCAVALDIVAEHSRVSRFGS